MTDGTSLASLFAANGTAIMHADESTGPATISAEQSRVAANTEDAANDATSMDAYLKELFPEKFGLKVAANAVTVGASTAVKAAPSAGALAMASNPTAPLPAAGGSQPLSSMFAAQQVNQALSAPTAPVGMYPAGTPPPASQPQYAAPAMPASPYMAAMPPPPPVPPQPAYAARGQTFAAQPFVPPTNLGTAEALAQAQQILAQAEAKAASLIAGATSVSAAEGDEHVVHPGAHTIHRSG